MEDSWWIRLTDHPSCSSALPKHHLSWGQKAELANGLLIIISTEEKGGGKEVKGPEGKLKNGSVTSGLRVSNSEPPYPAMPATRNKERLLALFFLLLKLYKRWADIYGSVVTALFLFVMAHHLHSTEGWFIYFLRWGWEGCRERERKQGWRGKNLEML